MPIFNPQRMLNSFVVLIACFALGTLCLPTPAAAQFSIKKSEDAKGPKLEHEFKQKVRIGVEITAQGGPCKGIVATVPVPTDWPEQQVKQVDEELSATVKNVKYRVIGGTVKQMRIEIPQLPSGQTAKALLTFEVTRSTLLPPEDTSLYTIPKKVDKDLLVYLGDSPFIESRHAKITALAKEVTADKEVAWEKVEAIYDWVRENIKYKNGALKGAMRALNDKEGDCEELSSLFIALCRASKIPARTVWVDQHCYPEFYLLDDDGKGHWFPCQAAGTRAFGGIPEQRAILQKGDNFKDPDRKGERLRYVSEFLEGAGVKGGGQPKVKFIREVVGA